MSPEKKYIVSYYMQSRVNTISPSATLHDAVERMLREKTNGLVVVDSNKKIQGILSSWDIIQYIVPDYLEADKHLASFEAGDLFRQRVEELKEVPVEKFMSSPVHTCREDHSLMEAATLLSEHGIRQLPVVDKEGLLVGYINRTDIKKAMGDILGITS